MRIAVTGAAGRLGRHVVARALRAGHDVIAVDLQPPPHTGPRGAAWRVADVTDLKQARAALADSECVIHLAGLTHPGYPEPEVHRVNVTGLYNVLLSAEESSLSSVCIASSVNAIGGTFSSRPRYDYFPIDEAHPSYCEDSYSLSKWIMEQQLRAFARRRPNAAFSALRFHALRMTHADAVRLAEGEERYADLWGWTSFDSAASACLLALLRRASGHAIYNIVAARTMSDVSSSELAKIWYPSVPLRRPLVGVSGFYSADMALVDLGWDSRVEHPKITDAESRRARRGASRNGE